MCARASPASLGKVMLFGAGKGKRQPGALPISQTPAAALPACLHPFLVPLLEALPQRDPTAWGGTPQPSLLSHRRARCQDVLEADPLSQCQDTAEGERQLRGQPAGKPGPHLGLSAPCSLPPSRHTAPAQGTHPLSCRDGCSGEGSFWGGEELDLPRVPGALPAGHGAVAGAARRGDSPERGTGTGSRDSSRGGFVPRD